MKPLGTQSAEIKRWEYFEKNVSYKDYESLEKDFADKIRKIQEDLRVARLSITARQVYEVNKKYDDMQKEILDAITYRYDQELKLADGNKDKI